MSEEYFVDQEYKVSDLAKLLDLTPETIRYYETVGIIAPRHDENNRYRYYLSTEFSKLYNAKLLRSLGYSLSDIKDSFYNKNNQEQKNIAEEQARALKEQVAELQRQIEVLGVMADELGMLDRLRLTPDITETDPFWLIPVRTNYNYDTDAVFMDRIKTFLENSRLPRYSYILRASMDGSFKCTDRYTGYSVHADMPKPTENAIYVPGRRALRFAYQLIAGERFDDFIKRIDLYQKFIDMGINSPVVNVYGHTINISTEDGVTYLNNIGYIPLEGGSIADWESISGTC